jgi:hypothetical protein
LDVLPGVVRTSHKARRVFPRQRYINSLIIAAVAVTLLRMASLFLIWRSVMKRKSVEILAAAVVLFMSVSPVMAVVEFNDGGVWDIDYEIIDDVWVDFETPGMGTTLNILEGGSILPRNLLKGFEDSIINMSGGSIGSLWAHDNSQVTISGEWLRHLEPIRITPE